MKSRFRPSGLVFLFAFQFLFAYPPQAAPRLSQKGTAVVATLSKSMNAKKLKSGDKITAQVAQDVLVNGKIVLPRNSKLLGHVAEVEYHTKSHPESRLALVFDEGQLKNHSILNLHGLLVAVGPPLVDPALEAIMASQSPYNNPEQTTARADGSNTPSKMTMDPREASASRAIERREQALDDATNPEQAGPGRNGALGANRRGVFGIPGLSLNTAGPVPTLVSTKKNVELKSGAQIVLLLDLLSPAQPQ